MEAAIGISALAFHPVFRAASAFAYDAANAGPRFTAVGRCPEMVARRAADPAQSVLLGMMFPLMAGGVLRAHPQRQGESIAMLYFTNSLGAAAGVLASGFFFIRTVGLPGTILTAGLLNLAVALAVWAHRGRILPARPLPELIQGHLFNVALR